MARLAGLHVPTVLIVLAALIAVVDVATKALAPWLKRAREARLSFLGVPVTLAPGGSVLGIVLLAVAGLAASALLADASGLLVAMPALVDLRQRRGTLVQQMRDVLKKAEDEKRSPTAEELQTWGRLDAEQEGVRQEIERIERQDTLERELAASTGVRAGKKTDLDAAIARRDRRAIVASEEYRDAWLQAMRDPQQLTGEQANVLTQVRALSAGTGSAGGFTVPAGFMPALEASLKYFGGMYDAATVFDTDSGQDLPWPTYDDTSNTGALLAENGSETTQDVTFAQITFKAYKYTSKAILVSLELLQDTAFNLEAELARLFGVRIGRITNTHFTTGDNSAKPQGIITAASTGKTGATGQTATVIYNDLVDLLHSVDRAYRALPGTGWMMNDASLAVVKKIRDDSGGAGVGRPLWEPSLVAGEPDRILGYPVVVNNDVATMAANAKSIAFGNLKKYMIRRVREVTVLRLVERYADAYQVGFQAFMRADGRMLDSGTDPVKLYVNSAT